MLQYPPPGWCVIITVLLRTELRMGSSGSQISIQTCVLIWSMPFLTLTTNTSWFLKLKLTHKTMNLLMDSKPGQCFDLYIWWKSCWILCFVECSFLNFMPLQKSTAENPVSSWWLELKLKKVSYYKNIYALIVPLHVQKCEMLVNVNKINIISWAGTNKICDIHFWKLYINRIYT